MFCCWNSLWVLKRTSGTLEREVVLQVRADLLVGALGVAGDAFEVRLDLRVVVDLEVVGRVDVPLEVVVPDPVLAEIRHVRRLGECVGDEPGGQNHNRSQQGQSGDQQAPARVRCALRMIHLEVAAEAGSPAARTRRPESLALADVTVAKTAVGNHGVPAAKPSSRRTSECQARSRIRSSGRLGAITVPRASPDSARPSAPDPQSVLHRERWRHRIRPFEYNRQE